MTGWPPAGSLRFRYAANSYSGAHDCALAGDGDGEVRRRLADGRDLDGLRAGDRVNCRLVDPGDADAFERTLLETLADSGSLGTRARKTVEHDFSWERYTDTLWEVLSAAWARDRS